MDKVQPKWIIANGLWNHFTGKKKYTLTCGNCHHTWDDKIPFKNIDLASSICPCCHVQNTFYHSNFARMYKERIK